EMRSEEVVPTYEELLSGSEVTFVQDKATQVDFSNRRVLLASGLHYDYQYLVLAVGSTQGSLAQKAHRSTLFRFAPRSMPCG
ncbi:MAG: hypothetical protein WA949_16355, partial [Phormidesmis sp.]